MAQGYAGTTAVSDAPRERTLNERLNKVAENLGFQCERIESVLSRVNGTPKPVPPAGDRPAQIHPTLPLAQIVEHLEAASSRLADLSSNVERIA